MSLDLTETAAAIERHDEIYSLMIEAADVGIALNLTKEQDEAARAIVDAFARETADRNDEEQTRRVLDWYTPADQTFIRRQVVRWRMWGEDQ